MGYKMLLVGSYGTINYAVNSRNVDHFLCPGCQRPQDNSDFYILRQRGRWLSGVSSGPDGFCGAFWIVHLWYTLLHSSHVVVSSVEAACSSSCMKSSLSMLNVLLAIFVYPPQSYVSRNRSCARQTFVFAVEQRIDWSDWGKSLQWGWCASH